MAFVNGQATGLTNAIPVAQMFNAANTNSIPNIKLVFGSATTTNGVATVNLTSDGTSTGQPLLSQILHADATAWTNSSTATQVPFLGGKNIASDQRSVSFNVLTGASMLLGGASVSQAPNGVSVTCVVWGLP